jgi:predicted dienelactone hydrolase
MLLRRLVSFRSAVRRAGSAALTPLLALPLLAGAGPARAIETVRLRLPLLQTDFVVKVSELADPQRLLAGNSDLAELDRAMGGTLGPRISELFATPLPLQVKSVVQNSVGSPLLEQALLAVSALGQIDDLPPDADGSDIDEALRRAAGPSGTITLLAFLQALPGSTVRVDLEPALRSLKRLARQQQAAINLAGSLPPVPVATALAAPGTFAPERLTAQVAVPHRTLPLDLVVLRPRGGGASGSGGGGNGRLVVISHGLWDGPQNFEGWAGHLASHGYTVVLPLHPGSDHRQQQAMLSGKAAPPSPQELLDRPLDITALLNAAQAGAIPALAGARTDRVVAIGHSWGATTVLQLAGVRPGAAALQRQCPNLKDPDRNMSWVLQCSFLRAADKAALPDPRVIAVAAVSPPLRLIFDHGSSSLMKARGLLVSGSHDWVVPPVPEALEPFATATDLGNQLVLVKGGDHFNLRGPAAGGGGPLRALLLAWNEAVFAAGDRVRSSPGAAPLLAPGAWGDAELPLVPVSREAAGR